MLLFSSKLMKFIEGNIRVMKEELKDDPLMSQSDEIREGYDIGNAVVNITHIPKEAVQNNHFHAMLEETNHVFAGGIECLYQNQWKKVNEREAIVFEPGEIHNVRGYDTGKEVKYPNAGNTIAGVYASYKIIPPYLDVKESELDLILKKDWFRGDFFENPEDMTTTPLYQDDKKYYAKFMEIAKRNREKISERVPELFK